MASLLITICARGGSKGITGKNIKSIGDRPLIGYSIELAKKFSVKNSGKIALSTDSDEIKSVAESFGLYTDYERPAKLATDTAGKVETIDDLLYHEEELIQGRYDYILDLDVTSPLRNLMDLSNAFEMLKADQEAYNIFSVSPPHRNPYFNMVESTENGYCQLVKTSGRVIQARQDTPKVYDMNASFYFYRRKFFDEKFDMVVTPKSMIYVLPHLCFDLDHPVDYEFLNFLIENKKLDFEF